VIENSEEPVQSVSDNGGGKKKKKRSVKKIIGIVVLALVGLVVVSTLFVNSATKAPLAVSDLFLNSVQAGDAGLAYELFSSEAKTTISLDELQSVVNQIGPILATTEKVTSKEIGGETGSAATSQITYEIKGTDGKTYTVIVNLMKENDIWRVLNFDSNAE
jgi:hypothetical protein